MTAQRSLSILIVLTALLALPSAAHAAGDRAAAKRFADAALRTKVAINAQAPEVSRRLELLNAPACYDALEAAPRSARAGAFGIYAAGLIDAFFTPTLPALRQLVADLDAAATKDRALRSGRSAWRASVALIERSPKVADPCAALTAWRDAGWTREAMPKLGTLETNERREKRLERKIAAAARRMRRLGVSRGAARRFTGQTLFSKIEKLVEDTTTTTESATTVAP